MPDLRPQPARPGRRGRRRRPGRPGAARRRGGRRRAARLRLRGPGRAGELAAGADRVAGQPARLLGQGQRVLPAPPARHRLVRCGPRRPAAEQRPKDVRLARRGARGQARPAAVAGLPDDLHHAVLRRRAAGRHLVREARPVHHRHAPVRARLHPGDRPAVADPHRLRRLPRHRQGLLRAGRRPISASARTWSRCRCCTTRRTSWPPRADVCATGADRRCARAGPDDAQARRRWSATTARSRRRWPRSARCWTGSARPPRGVTVDVVRRDRADLRRINGTVRGGVADGRPSAGPRQPRCARPSWPCPAPPTGAWPPQGFATLERRTGRRLRAAWPTSTSRSPSPTPRPGRCR